MRTFRTTDKTGFNSLAYFVSYCVCSTLVKIVVQIEAGAQTEEVMMADM